MLELATRPWADLPFVSISGNRVSLWAPARIPNYGLACTTGRQYAAAALDYIDRTGDMAMLQRIVADMPRGADMAGEEIGFFTGLASAAVAKHAPN